jgi:spore germination protein KC
MKRIGKLCFALLLIVASTTGCWNLRESDQLAFSLGTAVDLTKKGQVEVSVQIAIPSGVGGGQESGGGTNKKSFRVISATGKNVYDTIPNLQLQLSRSFFIGHRKIILFGQRLAEHGIGNLLDEFVRNPQSEMRARVYVVKDGQAKDILSVEPIFEPFTATALVHEQKTLGLKHYYFHDFISETLSQGMHPMLPAVSLTASKQAIFTGTAILNKDHGLKLMGFLDTKESSYANWIIGKQTGFAITSFVKQGNGNVSLNLQSLGRRIRVKRVDDRIQIEVRLLGKGTIVENNSNLDPTKKKDLDIIQEELRQTTRKSIQQMIEKVQQQYKTDIFGFGESVYRKYPSLWRTMKQDWENTFPELDVSVKVELQCKDPGATKSSIKVMP